MLIQPDTKVRDAVRAHPELKALLVSLDPRFKKLNNRAVFAMVGRWARIRDVARMGDMSLCVLLHTLNAAIGQEEALAASFPNCVDSIGPMVDADLPDWMAQLEDVEERDVRGRDDFFFPELEDALALLKPGAAIRVVNGFDPLPLKRVADEKGILHATESRGGDEVQVTFFRPTDHVQTEEDIESALLAAEVMDVRRLREDPFELIMKRAQSVEPGGSFAILQKFQPDPVIRMLEGMGFTTTIEERGFAEFYVRFDRPAQTAQAGTAAHTDTRVPVVLQSATPVVWPVIMRMMQSDRLLQHIRIDELKVWKDTERHMGWIARGKADITFSAVVAATKLFLSGSDIRMASVDVWDNFKLLSRGQLIRELHDIEGRKVHLPLIRSAPPWAVTRHILKSAGVDPDTVKVSFGSPFGRPEEMQAAFTQGTLDAMLIREPEASYALHGTHGVDTHELEYADTWRQAHPGVGDLPNAGLVFKGEFLREHPAEARIFMEELSDAIAWVTQNKDDAADLCWDIMGHSREEARFFLDRVHLEHVPSADARDAVEHYLGVLSDEGSLKLKAGMDAAMKLMM